ncbi:MAG TPA: tetratricopeptide repeat protein, partial [Anaerolineales bacterium]|nr:tetratricopeptide repeat protein [Anaerolineales bacterium]
MPVSILATKLYIPPPPPKVIARPRLSDQLNDGLLGGRKLTLISAPAGFGKSTLVSEWLTQCGRPAAWLSLDENDNDLGRFLTYLIHSLQKLAPNLGGELLEILQASQASPLEAILTALLNEIVALPHAFILVLDDYHAVDSKPIDEALTFLVEHLPPQMHLVLTTREDPALPLPRLRARGQLTELRAADLRFTPAEATEFLNQVMGFHLSVKQVAALETRTEGWIAGLQLAALSMKGTQDVAGFIQTFTGDHRYIADYLIEEVLHHQPDPVRNFLLQTSILDRLNGSLCDAVTRQSGGQARLEALQRGNFFLIPLDDRRHWYRYHHLFAEVLRLHLKAEQPEQVSALHRRASVWYEENGSAGNAIHHALAAEDFERAANLIEREVPETRRLRREATLLGWLKALPEEIFHNRPVLDVHYVGTLLQLGQMEGVEAHLQNAERWLASDIHESPLFADEEEFQRLPSLVAMYHAAISLMQGRVAETIRYARQVLERARAKDNFLRGAASALVGLASWTSGDLETAYQSYAEGMANLQREGFVSDVIGGAIALAEIRLTQGRLHEAIRIYTRGLQLATEKGTPGLRGTADMYVGLSTLAYEQNDIKTAEQHLLKSEELGVFAGFPQNPYRWRVAMAHIRAAQGDLDGALILLEEAERLYISDFYPNLRPVAAFKAQVWLAHGRLGEALNWARARGLSAGDELSYLSEFEHLT